MKWEHLQEDRNYLKNKQILELKDTITELENVLERFKDKLKQAEKWVSKYEDKSFEITESEEQKEKRMKKLNRP